MTQPDPDEVRRTYAELERARRWHMTWMLIRNLIIAVAIVAFTAFACSLTRMN